MKQGLVAESRVERASRKARAAHSLRARLLVSVGGAALFLALRLLGWTTRKTFVDADELLGRFARGEQVILSFWHGRMVMMPFAYRGRRACIMNSRHRDGELISRAIQRLGIEVVRGSSTRGWVGGLKGMLDAHRRGRDLVVVPDGPRGPRCRAKSGVIQLARATGVPIYPVAYAASRFRVLRRSWDWLSIPLPFARVAYVVGAPLRVPREATADEVEAQRSELERRLCEGVRRADRACGIAPELTEAYLNGIAARASS
jgi:lysophospholipid acyltransferase (LPLAT)-like uncharacterized protein